ncbi:MAG: GPW/gp25 family protein [Betaproteobacteria bacterium]|nr:GPW/gp25 family protein [Betaproteobacteria bacterium]
MKTPSLLSLPLLDGVDAHGRLNWTAGNKSLRECMLNILLTNPGERIMRAEFGAGLRNFIHYPNNETTRSLIADAARRALERWEPRVNVEEVSVLDDPRHLSQVTLSIRYRIRLDGSRERLDFSLSLGGSAP